MAYLCHRDMQTQFLKLKETRTGLDIQVKLICLLKAFLSK